MNRRRETVLAVCLTASLALFLASCDRSSDWQFCPGPGSACSCERNDCACIGGACEWRSEGGDRFRCAEGSSCYAGCTNDCAIDCEAGTDCTVRTGAASVVTCGEGATCAITCRGACEVTCEDPESCSIECLASESRLDGGGCS